MKKALFSLSAVLALLLVASLSQAQTATPTLTPTATATPTSTPTWSAGFPRGYSHVSDQAISLEKMFSDCYDERKHALRVIPLWALNSDGTLYTMDE